MFRKITSVAVFLLMLLVGMQEALAQELDSLKRVALDTKLQEYLSAISREPLEVQKEECDFLIDASTDSLVRQYVALSLYDHYMVSRLMGAEAVAIHILDKWFFPGLVSMPDEIDLINAKVYADFNRQSLLGEKAPELTMQDIDGQEVSLTFDDAGRYSVIYFYDTDCAKCRMESILLRSILEEGDYPVDFYAVYSGDRRDAWEKYVGERLDYDLSRTEMFHMWDPELDSDFQRKYGVLQTPRMYLIAPDGTILGRGLDSQALQIMLDEAFREVVLNYGTEESAVLFDDIFAESASAERVRNLVDYIGEGTLSKGDTVMFRQLSGDLLYYLASHSGEGVKEGLEYLIDKNILSRNDVWRTQDDSLKVIGFAQISDDLLSKSPKGSPVADLVVEGEYLTSKGIRISRKNLRKLRGDRNYIIFFTEGCDVCKAEKNAASTLVENDRRIRAFYVNVDEILATDPALAEILFETFDLSTLPYILETDRKGLILRRYISLY